jgi:hypothetical protein
MTDRIIGYSTFNEWKSRMFHREYHQNFGPTLTIRKLFPPMEENKDRDPSMEESRQFWKRMLGLDDDAQGD